MTQSLRWLTLALMCALPTTAAADVSQPQHPEAADSLRARSLGWPWAGSLKRGVYLSDSPRIRHLPAYARDRNFYGTGELVSMLDRGARAVAQRWPGSRLSIGELSARRGGRLERHRSHRSGRDADVAFYMRDERDGFVRFAKFLGFGRHAPLPNSPRDMNFDDGRNWELVQSWLTDSVARIQYVFVAEPVRNRLLVEARRRGVGPLLLRKAAAVLIEPERGESHDDHFHVRIYCPTDHRPRCKDGEPYWPWYDGRPPDGVHAPLPTVRWRPTEL